MRDVRLTLGLMALVVLLVSSVWLALLVGLRAVGLVWPWHVAVPLIVCVAAEGVVTQRLVARQRLSLSEQLGVRAGEWLLIVLLVRLAGLLVEERPWREVVRPWLRDPLLVFSGRFPEYLLLALGAWLLATWLTQVVILLEQEALASAPPEHHPNLTIEQAEAVEERLAMLRAFDRAWAVCLLLALLGAVVAGPRPGATVAFVAVALVLLIGLLLRGWGQSRLLLAGWRARAVAVDADVARRWWRPLVLLTLLAGVLGLALGGIVARVPPPPLIPLLNLLLLIMAYLLAALIALIGLLLLPFAWLLAWLLGEPPPELPRITPLSPPQLPTGPVERPLLPALIFWSCVALLIAMAATRYLQQRADLREVIGRQPLLRRVWNWLRSLWRDLGDWSQAAATMLRTRLTRRRRARLVVPVRRTSRADLRRLYRRLRRVALAQGVATPPSQTPYELRAALSRRVPEITPDLEALTDVYVRSEYGPEAPRRQEVRRARTHWRRIARRVARRRRPGL